MTADAIKLLLVEDDADDARHVRDLLLRDGGSFFTVSDANRLAAARQIMAASELDLILLDLSLPDAQGLAALREIQQARPGVPIVVISQLGDESLALRALQEGAQDYLVKGRIDGPQLARSMRYAIQRKLVEEKLRGALAEAQTRRAKGTALLKSAREVLHSKDLRESARTVFLACKDTIAAAAGLVVLLTPEGHLGEQLYSDLGDTPEHLGVDAFSRSGLQEQVIRTGDSAWRNDMAVAPIAGELDNLLCVPLIIKEQVAGLVYLANKRGGFDGYDAELAFAFAEIIAVALYTHRNLAALERSERKYRALFDNANDALFLHNLTSESHPGRFIEVNEVATRLYGYSREELLGMAIKDLDAIAHAPQESAISPRLREKGHLTYEVVAKAKDGRLVPTEVSSHMFTLHGQDVVLSIGRDISERKRVEKALRQSEEHYRTLFEAAPIGIYRTTPDGRIENSNPALLKMLGYDSFEDLSQRNLERDPVYGPELSRAEFKEMIERDGEVRGLEAVWLRRDGSRIIVRESARAIKTPDGSIVAYEGTVEDITSERRAKQSLEESQQRERLILRSLPMAQYTIAVADGLGAVWMSDQVKAISGFKPARFAHSHQFWSNRLHPDDRDRVLGRLDSLGKTDDDVQLEYRWRCADGSYRWFFDQAVLIRDERGQPKEIIGNWLDITDRKRTEEDLRHGVERLRRMLEGSIRAMALAVETRDPYTAGHQRRVAELAEAIARRMSLGEEQVTVVKLAATVHDIGKIGVPAEILSRPGRINALEFRLIRSHPQVGYDILCTIEFPWPIADVVLQHHERLDGSGYPKGITGDEMMLEARILAVADVVEAMASHRPYRPALGVGEALAEISRQGGLLYDPAVVTACQQVFSENELVWL